MILLLAALLAVADVPVAPRAAAIAGQDILNARVAYPLVAWTAEDGIYVTLPIPSDQGRRIIAGGILRDFESTLDGYLLAYEAGDDVHVATLNADGEVVSTEALHTGPIPVALARAGGTTRVFPGAEAAAATQFSFLVLYREDQTIYARAFDPKGMPLSDKTAIGVSDAPPAIASDGRELLAIWRSPAGTLEARGIGTSGAPSSDVFTIAKPPSRPEPPVIGWTGTSYRIAYAAADGLRMFWFGGSGGPMPEQFQPANERVRVPQDFASAALLTIERVRCGRGSTVHLGTDLGSNLVSRGEAVRRNPAVAPVGTGFQVVFDEQTDAARIRSRQRVLSTDYTPEVVPAIASSGRVVLAAWLENEPFTCETQLQAVALRTDGTVLNRWDISTLFDGGVYGGRTIAAAWHPYQFALVWTDYRMFGPVTVGIRVNEFGDVPTGEPRDLVRDTHTATLRADVRHQTLVWTGSEYLLIREGIRGESHTIRVQRLSAALDPIGADYALGPGTMPHAAAGTTGTLVVAHDGGALRARLISNSGAVLRDFVLPVQTDSRPSVAALGEEFIVAAGETVFRIGDEVTALTTLPAGARDTVVAMNVTRAGIVYVLGNEIYIREVAVPVGRMRSVRR